MITSKSRGHDIYFNGKDWVYTDNGNKINDDRPCKHCGNPPVYGKDSCIGDVLGAESVCCGHGDGIVKILAGIELKFVESVDDDKDIVARAYYPDEGSRIEIAKGKSKAIIEMALIHEIGHFVDWYLSKGKQSKEKIIREMCADSIYELTKNENKDIVGFTNEDNTLYQNSELQSLSIGIIKWLCDYKNPHCKVVVSCDGVEMIESIEKHKIQSFIKD